MVVQRRIRQWISVGLSGLVGILICFAGAIALGHWNPVQAQSPASVEQLQQQQLQIDRERSLLNQEQEHLQRMETSAQNRLGNLQQTIQATTQEIQTNEQRLKQANEQLQALENTLAIAEKGYQEQQVATAARLRYLQRQPKYKGWAALLQSQTFQEFLDRRYKLGRVYQADQQILADLRQGADEVDQRRIEVAQQKNEIALITEQLYIQKSQFEGQAQSQQAQINRLRTDRSALEAAEERLAQDSQGLTTIIQELLAAQSRNQVVVRGTGRFSLPSDGFISSSFGWRTHPILGYQRFHAGVDFGADYGSTIRAADRGSVIFAGWYGGYGLTVIVDHGGGLTSLYAHTSEVYVKQGQTVQKGEAIAAVGSTGLSTGPHLHFEVRANGEPIDPMPYL
jgi:murein DD-endopeptidase MepM/ murein hydrolase activator NlpD